MAEMSDGDEFLRGLNYKIKWSEISKIIKEFIQDNASDALQFQEVGKHLDKVTGINLAQHQDKIYDEVSKILKEHRAREIEVEMDIGHQDDGTATRFGNQNGQIAWRAGILGSGFGIGFLISFLADSSWRVFGWYLALLTFFHYSEYLTTAMTNPKSLSLDSFLLNHSKEYGIAAVGSWVEFIVERYFCSDMKQLWWLNVAGLLLCIGGEITRKIAMLTAGSNFNHIIQSHREEGHMLVAHGIYSLFRHPAYVGWFWWSIGTQMLLCNPLCFIGYTIASWRFFKRRIVEEEITLLNFFGEDYVSYQRRVPTGLPFIKGYRLEL